MPGSSARPGGKTWPLPLTVAVVAAGAGLGVAALLHNKMRRCKDEKM